MGKRLRRDTEELDASTSFDIDSNLAASISQDEPCEQNNIRQPQKYAIPTACDSKGYGIAIQCTLPPHQPTSFLTQSDFETHYQKDHANRCSACSKNFPTEHYMYLHIAENHDPINEVLKQSNARIVLLCYSKIKIISLIMSIVRLFRGRMRSQMLHPSEAEKTFDR